MTSSSGPARPVSPSNSFYALSDDEEGDYNTVTHIESGKGVKLLFSKSKVVIPNILIISSKCGVIQAAYHLSLTSQLQQQVYIHPTPSAKDNIPGYIALLQQKPPPDSRPTSSSSQDAKPKAAASLLLAWLPESSLGDALNTYVKVDLAEGDSPPKQSYLVPPPPTTTTHSGSVGHYAFAIPVSQVYSLLVRPPSLGWWFGSVVINSRVGDSFPALFFHDSECQSTILQKKKRTRESFDPFGANGEMFWGGDEVLRWLRRYVEIERSGAEPNIYLVEPSVEDKEAFGDKPVTSAPVRRPTSSGARVGSAAGAGSSSYRSAQRDAGMDPVTKFVKETGWNLMEKFSKVTTFTRRTADSIVDNPKVPPQVRRFMKNPEVQTLQEEFDSARIYLARWAMGIAEQSERDRNQRIWTARDVLEMEETDVGEFELLETEMGSLTMREQRKTVTLREWNKFFDQRTGRLSITVDEVKERVFHGGLDPDDGVRKEAWLFLLGVYEWDSSADERKAVIAGLRDEYVKLKGAWWDRLIDLGGEGEEGDWWREQKNRIEKDVHRTDRNIPLFEGEDTPHPDPDSPFADVGTNVHLEQMKDMLLSYNEYNRDLGYVQGMSDLLAPIYAVMQDDAIAFWGFQHFMERMECNFLRDQSGMRSQLLTLDHLVQLMDPKLYLHLQSADSTNFFFFFRMLLVWYKREFAWLDVLHLWEILWTDFLSSGFHLFIALAILEKHRDVIMTHLQHFDEVLKYVNELSNQIDLESTLVRAEALFHRFQRTVEAIDKKSSFPKPSVRRRGTQSTPQASGPSGSSGVTSGADTGSGAIEGARKDKGKKPNGELEDMPERPKVISKELRDLLSKKVVVLPRKVVRREGEGLAKVQK
ncbi:GTPase-activating protein GYP7 [Sclerotinia borealis F-4128]|uniref:GTPase-activating protein GYP7 n=1 Tax=Sclerotinia borealis (strain F-4128) TaxID=1432307 RepID=W9C3Y8_SCLBF|nr:GTPase-activating protein GYP7 [Sclerotinia borealis F-4128]